jgi:hypothetical protein
MLNGRAYYKGAKNPDEAITLKLKEIIPYFGGEGYEFLANVDKSESAWIRQLYDEKLYFIVILPNAYNCYGEKLENMVTVIGKQKQKSITPSKEK